MSNCSIPCDSELSFPFVRGTGWEVAADRSWDTVLQHLGRITTDSWAVDRSYHLVVVVHELLTDPRLPEELRATLRASDADRLLWGGSGSSEDVADGQFPVDASDAESGSMRDCLWSASSDRPSCSKEHRHARLARELREMTGMSARELGSCLGVSREQYSRWISGRPISDHRCGQLVHLHTVMRDLVRRLGTDQTRIWLRTPVASAQDVELITPVELLQRRLVGQILRMITDLPDPNVGQEPALLVLEEDDPADHPDSWNSEPWTPYGSSVSKRDESGSTP